MARVMCAGEDILSATHPVDMSRESTGNIIHNVFPRPRPIHNRLFGNPVGKIVGLKVKKHMKLLSDFLDSSHI